jgi:hypothetical protein
LRSWLETNIEVVAKDPDSQIIEKLPLRLDAADLATYCHRVMGDFREDRAFAPIRPAGEQPRNRHVIFTTLSLIERS